MDFFFLQSNNKLSMPCPCANPPGTGKKPVPRNPYTLKPLGNNAPVSRKDIRMGRVKRVMVDDESNEQLEPEKREEKKVVWSYRPRRPMGGFLSSDVMRKR